MRQYMYSHGHVLYLGLHRKYKTQTGYTSPYYLSKAYITNIDELVNNKSVCKNSLLVSLIGLGL